MSGLSKLFVPLVLSSSLAMFTACSNGGSSGTQIRVMNASPDAGALNFTVNSQAIGSNVSYTSVSDYKAVGTGSQSIEIQPPSSSTVTLTQSLNLESGSKTTVLAANFVASLTAVAFIDDATAPASGQVKLRLIHAAPSLGTSDIFVVAPNTDLNTATPAVPAQAFQNGSGYLNLAAGTYEVIYTIPNSTFVLFDAGAFTLTAGQNRTIVAVNSPSGGFSTVVLKDLN